MALVRLPGCNNNWLTDWPPFGYAPSLNTLTCDALADRITMIGRFEHQDQVSKTISGVEFLFGTVVKAAGSTFQASLQNVDLTTGPVGREDGTPDQTMTIANADAGFASNLWYGGNFDAAATRTLAIGELVAVVCQFATFTASDTVALRGMTRQGFMPSHGFVVANLTGSYVVQTMFPNVILRCNDGTYGTITSSWPCSALNTHTFQLSTGVADEYALGIQWPFPCEVNALWVAATLTTATDTTEIILYDGTTAMLATTIDHNTLASTTAPIFLSIPPQTQTKNALYRLGIRPLGGNISLNSTDVATVNHLTCLPGGLNFHQWTRLDQGAWGGEVTTRRLVAGVRLSAFDDAVSAGGGVPLLGRGLVQ